MPSSLDLDPETLRAVIAQVEHHLAELDRRSAHCTTCGTADLKRHLGWLRGMLTGPPSDQGDG
jgi:hypothetical protein